MPIPACRIAASLVAALFVLIPTSGRALVVDATLGPHYSGPFGGLTAHSVDVAARQDGVLGFLFESPNLERDGGDDAMLEQRLYVRRYALDGTWRGEGRIDGTATRDLQSTILTIDDGYLAAWATAGTSANAARIFFSRLASASHPENGPITPIVDAPTQASAPLALAPTPTGFVVCWSDGNGVHVRRFAANGTPVSGVFDVAPTGATDGDVAALPNGGFVVAWRDVATVSIAIRAFSPSGAALGPAATVLSNAAFPAVAASGDGTAVVTALRLTPSPSTRDGDVLARRFDPATELPIGGEIPVTSGVDFLTPDLGFDRSGNLLVLWAHGPASPTPGAQAAAFDAAGSPLGSPLTLSTLPVVGRIRLARLDDGRFVAAYVPFGYPAAKVLSLCEPGSAVCGDGTFVPTCERCDDGAANSDTAPDACRTTCELPRCGDGVVDTGESCDDANTIGCDGCSASCGVEDGLVCGDGVVAPEGCGEDCDDGNAVVGDGCTPGCAWERAPGGGAAATDCVAEWRAENPANVPLLDKKGRTNGVQTCVDDDPRCDFDGGQPGACIFHVGVCGNNADVAGCAPPRRLASWTLDRPSAAQALGDPALESVRTALLGAVPGSVVGSEARDVCSPFADVPVPLRGSGSAARAGKLALKTRASTYDGRRDLDKLKLVCLPAAP